jgi:predicted transcriptional regulator of viral defense system
MAMEQNLNNTTFARYLDILRAKGRYSFTLAELERGYNLSYRSIKQGLYRLKIKNKIAQIRQGFYVIVPPEYASIGTLPEDMYIDNLMEFLGKNYYVGLLSAAALHGAAHQKPMTYFVVSQHPAPRNISNPKQRILFFSKQNFIPEGVIQKKTLSGYINVASPELTAFDLLDNIKRFGINRITTILQELYEEMRPSRLAKIAKSVDNKASIQRLGYILETVAGAEKLAEALQKILSQTAVVPVPLSPVKVRRGAIDSKWKIIVNMEIEPDL